MKTINQIVPETTELGNLDVGDVFSYEHHSQSHLVTNAGKCAWLNYLPQETVIHSVDLGNGSLGTSSPTTQVILYEKATVYLQG